MFGIQERLISQEKKWIKVESNLVGVNGQKSEINIELLENNKPRAMAFFDIDGTLAHLGMIHGKAINRIFAGNDPVELEKVYYAGFKLGNSFREFDRMKGIYVNGKTEWKDPEFYIKNRLIPFMNEIDEPGNPAHDRAAEYLRRYGEIAGSIADEVYKENPEEFKKANIQPILKLANMYSRLGIPMVGFTANAKIFVERIAKYLELSNLFLYIATDEAMAGGGKEVAIHSLIKMVEAKGISVPKNNLIFVGDSIRGDIGTCLLAREKDKEIHGQGILILKNKEELVNIKKQINENPELNRLVNSIEVHGLMVDDVPKDEKGNPMLLSRFRDKFLEKL